MLPLLGLLLAAAPAASPFDLAAHTPILTAHAEGAQIYECKPGPAGALQWTLREPIATLIVDGRTVGRHHAGPHWVLDDGSLIQGKMVATALGETPSDVAQLELAVVDHQGTGALSQAAFVYRLHTHGGALAGVCTTAGARQPVAYSADYIFTR